MIRNPKQDGSNIWSCRVQTGLCPIRCNQCFYNRDNGSAFYCDINEPHVPDPAELPEGAIVRMNDGHDSSIELDKVLEQAAKYKDVFFNTSRLVRINKMPAPIVLTVNPDEKHRGYKPSDMSPTDIAKLMFVRVRVSTKYMEENLNDVWAWIEAGVPVVMTFMAYFDKAEIEGDEAMYEYRKRHINSYWCIDTAAMILLVEAAKTGADNLEQRDLIFTCGTAISNWCKDCGTCEKLYLKWKAMQ